jgi:AraC family transcriptional regulator of adaptative response/methylated-DNA-[protein]-cysteine methyltransferase
MEIQYAIVDSAFGRLLVGATRRGVCAVALGSSDAALVRGLAGEYPSAVITAANGALDPWTSRIVARLDSQQPRTSLPVDVRATAFQRQVWNALESIPYGETRSYAQVAASIGRPRAARAVARACATNPLAVVIPCHRVVPSTGGLGGYRWGTSRKRALLAREREGHARRG